MTSRPWVNLLLAATVFAAGAATAVTGLFLWLVVPEGRELSVLRLLGLTRPTWIGLHLQAWVLLVAGIVVHLVLHWRWIAGVAPRLFGKIPQATRLNLVVDALLLAFFAMVSVAGLVGQVLPSGGFRGGRGPVLRTSALGVGQGGGNDLHLWLGLALVALVTLHLILHRQWIARTLRQYTQLLPAHA